MFGVHFKTVLYSEGIHYSVLATCKNALLLTFFVPASLLHKTSENGRTLQVLKKGLPV